MEEQELILEAIDHYSSLSPSARIILKVLVQVAIDDIAIIRVEDLAKLSKFSKMTVYSCLAALEKEKLMEKASKPRAKLGTYALKSKRFEEIIKRYQLQKSDYIKYFTGSQKIKVITNEE